MSDARWRWISKIACQALNASPNAVDGAMQPASSAELVRAFLQAEQSVTRLLFYKQAGDDGSERVFMTNGDAEPLTGRCCFFVRVVDKPVTPANVDVEVNFGTLEGGTLESLSRLLTDVYQPCLSRNTFDFMKKMKKEELEELDASNARCVKVVEQAIESLSSGLELAKVDGKFTVSPPTRPLPARTRCTRAPTPRLRAGCEDAVLTSLAPRS